MCAALRNLHSFQWRCRPGHVYLGHVMRNTAILLVACPDQRGLVASIADFVYRHGGNILHADEHGDLESDRFLMRVEFDPSEFDIDLARFAEFFLPIAEKFGM